jgi:hypothetical protein
MYLSWMREATAVPVGLLVLGICSVALLVVILAGVIRLSAAALGTPGDRAAADETLRRTAGLLGGRFRDRREYPWYRRPAQYGGVEGNLGELDYELYIMPWNAEDCGGSSMLRIRSRHGGPLLHNRPELVIFTSARAWHWPDLADPHALADQVHHAIAAVALGEAPPETWNR